MIEFPKVSKQIVDLAEIALLYDVPWAGIPGGRPMSHSLQRIAEFLREVIRNPLPPMVATFPAIPPILDDETKGSISSGKQGTRAFRAPGSAEETISTDFPSTIWAKRCLEIAERLLAALEGKSKNVPRSLIDDAIEFGAFVPRILEFYNGQFESGVNTFVKRNANSVRQRERALKNVKLTNDEWELVRIFIERETKKGVSATEACRRAEGQLTTGIFPKIGRRITIGVDALRIRWRNSLKPPS